MGDPREVRRGPIVSIGPDRSLGRIPDVSFVADKDHNSKAIISDTKQIGTLRYLPTGGLVIEWVTDEPSLTTPAGLVLAIAEEIKRIIEPENP